MIGNLHRPHLLEAWGQRFQVQLEDNVTLFRYNDVPGMLGRVGTLFGATTSTSSPRSSAASRRATVTSRLPRW